MKDIMLLAFIIGLYFMLEIFISKPSPPSTTTTF